MPSNSAWIDQQAPNWMAAHFPDHKELKAWTMDEKNALLADISSFLQAEWPPVDGTKGHPVPNIIQLDMYTNCCLIFKRHVFSVMPSVPPVRRWTSAHCFPR